MELNSGQAAANRFNNAHGRKRSRQTAFDETETEGSFRTPTPDSDDDTAEGSSWKDIVEGRGSHLGTKMPSWNEVTNNNPPQALILHRVHCSRARTSAEDHSQHDGKACYLDRPRLFKTDTRAHALRGLEKIDDVEEYLERHPEYVIVIYLSYDCQLYHEAVREHFQKQVPPNMAYDLFLKFRAWFYSLPQDMQEADPQSETLSIVSQSLTDVLNDLVESNEDTLGPWDEPHNLMAPFTYFLHHHSAILSWAEDLPATQNKLIEVLMTYIDGHHGGDFRQAQEKFESGVVAKGHFSKLFRTKDLIVHETGDGIQAYRISRIASIQSSRVDLECTHWMFDGTFKEVEKLIIVEWPGGAEAPIASLTVYPLQFDQANLSQRLQERGTMFWSCRRKKLVGYSPRDASSFELHTAHPKYMIDLETHRYLHPDSYPASNAAGDHLREVSAGLEDPPEDPTFLLLLPPIILGYGFHDKKWRTLQAEHICDITWNTKAFDRLVLNADKKELIEAVVTSHIEKNKGIDVVEDKGNGLILLLHGPPGTGKTLTAESVAELANKPLYRITCGDIGTEPQEVETYLESALYIGSVWGCVVLLDEADVFLEERTQTDLVRNALVSVFLRVLEYYDGILILTSNRVGLFDEAFKSRMQLTVCYPRLDSKGRKEIWRNLFSTLATAGIEFNHEELNDRVASLAEFDLNGRQIRNTIKTARQLAKFHHQKLTSRHLEKVIQVSEEFDKYLKDTKGYTDEQLAAEQGLRKA